MRHAALGDAYIFAQDTSTALVGVFRGEDMVKQEALRLSCISIGISSAQNAKPCYIE